MLCVRARSALPAWAQSADDGDDDNGPDLHVGKLVPIMGIAMAMFSSKGSWMTRKLQQEIPIDPYGLDSVSTSGL